MNIYEKLTNITSELHAPKNMKNSFGNYSYRNAESIYEAVKPLLIKYKCALFLTDRISQKGERTYVEATATLVDIEKPEDIIVNVAYAREEEVKKGMDASQVTGACSSYSRKYCLAGLFLIDASEDADSDNYTKKVREGKSMKEELLELASNAGKTEEDLVNAMKIKSLDDVTPQLYGRMKATLIRIANNK